MAIWVGALKLGPEEGDDGSELSTQPVLVTRTGEGHEVGGVLPPTSWVNEFPNWLVTHRLPELVSAAPLGALKRGLL